MQKYKIIAVDVDGTLQNSKKQITDRTRKTIIRAQESGVKIVISSGRPTYGIAPLAKELEMERFGGYVLAFNGGEITDWQTKQQMYEQTLPPDVIPQLYQRAKDNGFDILVYHGNTIVIEDATNQYALLSSSRNRMTINQVSSFVDEVTYPVHKCLIVGNPEKLGEFEVRIKKDMEGVVNICRSEPYFMEVTPLNIDKANGLAVLLQKIGISPAEMMAFGDANNDMSMLQFAGMGIAMSNANDDVKAVADYITLSNDEDGVADAIERLCLWFCKN